MENVFFFEGELSVMLPMLQVVSIMLFNFFLQLVLTREGCMGISVQVLDIFYWLYIFSVQVL